MVKIPSELEILRATTVLSIFSRKSFAQICVLHKLSGEEIQNIIANLCLQFIIHENFNYWCPEIAQMHMSSHTRQCCWHPLGIAQAVLGSPVFFVNTSNKTGIGYGVMHEVKYH